jgi:16S rRNA processing protein RimM
VHHAAERPSKEHKRGSGEQGRPPEPRYLAVGQIIGAHGLRGELKVEILTDDPRRFGQLRRVFLGLEDSEPRPRRLVSYRLHKGRALLQIEGCIDRGAAQALRGYLIQVPLEEAIPLEEDQFFEHQILGLEVWTRSGTYLGRVDEIIHTGANEVYVVRNTEPGQREILIPAIHEVVQEVDLEVGRLTVELLPGLV